MKPLPTDYQILKEIYERYFDEFANFSKGTRASKIYIPIDIEVLARDLKVDPDLIFGRLYYSLDKKYGYKTGENSRTHLFTPKAGSDANAVNFPLLSSVLAGLHEERSKTKWATIFSVVALVISIISMWKSGA